MPKYKEDSTALIEIYRQYCNLLIVTATDVEKNVLHEHLQPIEGQEAILKLRKAQYTYYVGKFGHYNAIHVATANMGAINRGSAIPTTMTAIENWRPKAVIMIGIAMGGNPKDVRIGDVLVSERVVNYESMRLNKDGSFDGRPKEGPASSLLLDRFNSVDGWEFLINCDGNKYTAIQKQGVMLSGEKLVDDPVFKDALMKRFPSAIGGEMEGAGIYAACEGQVQHWILVKSVCDFGDGTKGENPNKELFQEIAIRSAVSLAENVFNSQFGFEDIGLYSGPLLAPATHGSSKKKSQ